MPKNIVVFADGTGQDGGVAHNTNVYELFNILEDRSERQTSFYDRGLGTGRKKAASVMGSITGRGIAANTQECYEFISDCYNAGDQIYLFGFSRGATTVRTLAAFIHRFGILPRSRPELIQRAYRIYKIRNKEKRRKQAKEFLRLNHTMWCRIKFLGVWDTVAALGLPFKTLDVILDRLPIGYHSYHDLRLSKCVDVARHALAIDDERLTFHPSLWDERVEREEIRQRENATLDFSAEDLTDISLVATKLNAAKNMKLDENSGLVYTRVLEEISDPRIGKLLDRFGNRYAPGDRRKETELRPEEREKLTAALVSALNAAMNGESLVDPESFDSVDSTDLSKETKDLYRRIIRRSGEKVLKNALLNRQLLQDAYALKPANPPRVKQVWFAGMHTDVGGGYPENELAHVPLLWMLKEAMDAGLLIYPKHKVEFKPDATGMMHDSREKLGRFYRRRVRSWDPSKHQGRKARVHESVVMRHQCEDLQYEPWILKQDVEYEPWPKRLMSSVQFDDYFIWRESVWGFDSAFSVPWTSVKRISFGQVDRTIKLNIRGRGEKNPIVIKGISSAEANEIASAFERRRGEAQEAEQQALIEKLRAKDQEHDEEIDELKAEIKSLKSPIGQSNGKTGKATSAARAAPAPAPSKTSKPVRKRAAK